MYCCGAGTGRYKSRPFITAFSVTLSLREEGADVIELLASHPHRPIMKIDKTVKSGSRKSSEKCANSRCTRNLNRRPLRNVLYSNISKTSRSDLDLDLKLSGIFTLLKSSGESSRAMLDKEVEFRFPAGHT